MSEESKQGAPGGASGTETLHMVEFHDGCDILTCEVKRELTGLAHGVGTIRASLSTAEKENTRLKNSLSSVEEDLRVIRLQFLGRLGPQPLDLARENTRLRERVATLVKIKNAAADVTAIWRDFTSQEMYGESLTTALPPGELAEMNRHVENLRTAMRELPEGE